MTEKKIRAMFKQANEARHEGRFNDAESLLNQAFELSVDISDEDIHAEYVSKLAQIKRDLNNPSEAIDLYEEAIECYRHLGRNLAIAHCLRHLGDIQRENGDISKAETHLLSALDIYRDLPTKESLAIANTLRPLALLNEALGRMDRAMAFWSEALAYYSEAKVEAGIAECRAHLDGYSPSQ